MGISTASYYTVLSVTPGQCRLMLMPDYHVLYNRTCAAGKYIYRAPHAPLQLTTCRFVHSLDIYNVRPVDLWAC